MGQRPLGQHQPADAARSQPAGARRNGFLEPRFERHVVGSVQGRLEPSGSRVGAVKMIVVLGFYLVKECM